MTSHGAYTAGEARSYDSDREVEPLWHAENAYVAGLFDGRRFDSILDAPVGTGRFFDLYTSRRVVGIDLSDAMLHEAAGKAAAMSLADVTLLNASVTSLPFADSEFDLVLCWRLMHLLPPETLVPAFAELRRVCAGTLCVQVYVKAGLPHRALAWAGRWMRRFALLFSRGRRLTPWSHITAYAHSRDTFRDAADAAGLGAPTRVDDLGAYEGTRVVAMIWTRNR